MAFTITNNALIASKNTNIQPNIVLEIDGVSTLYGAIPILEVVKIGDPGLIVGMFVVGGFKEISDQKSYISFQGGTSNSIKQTLKQEKGEGDGVANFTIALIDKNKEITDLISPGMVVPDILGIRAKVYFGFYQSGWPEDYIVIHRGIVETIDAKPGLISFNITHPDQKKRQTIFIPAETALDGAINDSVTTITVDDTATFLLPIIGPDGVNTDPDFKTYIRIDDEVMEVDETTVTATTFDVVRGVFDTIASSHDDNATVSSVYQLVGTNIQLALKLMLSGKNDYIFTDVPVKNFVRISPTETVANSIFFENVDVSTKYNLQVGDFCETTGASNGANNISASPSIFINGIITTNLGSYITLAGVSFVEENDSSAVISFRSQYDVWPTGAGVQMFPDEVDINEHLNIEGRFIPGFEMDFRLQDEVNAKEFISEQLMNPASCFTLPRKAQASMGIHTPPLPDEDIKVFDINNVTNPSELKISRSLNKNRTTTVIYKFDEFILEPDEFEKSRVALNNTAIDQTGGTQRSIVLESKGMRDILSADILADAAAARRLRKYAFGSEYIGGLKLHFRDGFNAEVGDKILLDMSSLKISDIQSGTRSGESRIFEIDNITKNLRTGETAVSIVDTNFNKDARFGLIGPSSRIKSAVSDTVFVIEESYGSRFGINEFLKWTKFDNPVVQVRSLDYTDQASSAIADITGNQITLATGLGFTPSAGYVMEYSDYSDQTVENVKVIYTSLSDDVNDFGDGGIYYGLF